MNNESSNNSIARFIINNYPHVGSIIFAGGTVKIPQLMPLMPQGASFGWWRASIKCLALEWYNFSRMVRMESWNLSQRRIWYKRLDS